MHGNMITLVSGAELEMRTHNHSCQYFLIYFILDLFYHTGVTNIKIKCHLTSFSRSEDVITRLLNEKKKTSLLFDFQKVVFQLFSCLLFCQFFHRGRRQKNIFMP